MLKVTLILFFKILIFKVFPVQHSYYPAFLLSSIPTVQHSYCPAFLLSSIPTVLHSYSPAFLLSSILTVLHSYCPAFLLSSILTVQHLDTALSVYIYDFRYFEKGGIANIKNSLGSVVILLLQMTIIIKTTFIV